MKPTMTTADIAQLAGVTRRHATAEPSASSASEMASWRCKLRQRLSYLFAE